MTNVASSIASTELAKAAAAKPSARGVSGKAWARRAARDLPLFALSLLPLMAAGGARAAGPVLPTGGKVVAGQASIGSAHGGSLTVTQSSGKAILSWQGFSIGSGGKVQIDNGSGATLNRVTGSSVSSLNGLLSATGSVYLLNPNGVIVGRSGVVNVGGTFVASTLNLTDANFLGGGALSFKGASNAAVVNLGKIGALGGDVGLIAATVDNEGGVTAANGTAGLVSGYSVVMRDAALDDGLFSVLVGGPGTGVTNGGAILAANAELRAEQGNVYALAGNTAGTIRATGVKAGQGRVWLTADGGTLDVAGTIEASAAGGKGGAIETSGEHVSIGKASIDAHGGSWLVDPVDLTIDAAAATTIDAALNAGTNVTESTNADGTTSGTTSAGGDGTVSGTAGDIIVAAPISWSTAAGLTLSAYHDVDVNAAITSTGGGAVTLQADNSATGAGTVAFGAGGGVSTSGATTILYNPATFGTATDYTANVTGGGTLAAYMLVNTAADLQAISTNLAGDYALNPGLPVDPNTGLPTLDVSSLTNFTPIGTDAAPFTGVFNGAPLFAVAQGQGEVANLTINLPNTISVGLFGNVGKGGVVENLALEGGSVTGFNAVGGVAGKNSGTVIGVDADVNVTGTNAVGGVVGKNFADVELSESGFFQLFTSSGGPTISGTGDYVGGVIGYNTVLAGSTAPSTAVASGVYSLANVTGSGDYIGGLVGYNSVSSIVEANTQPSVLIGPELKDSNGTPGNFFGTVSGTGASSVGVGGVAGYNAGTVSGASTKTALVTNMTATSTGGVVGLNDVGGVVSGALLEGATVEGANATGGIVGKNYGTVTGSSVSRGDITGADAVGGIVGKNFDVVDSSYIHAGSAVSGASDVGGVVGYNTVPNGSNAQSTAIVEGSYTGASTTVTGTGTAIGGLVGYNDVGSTVTGSTGGGGFVTGPGAADAAIGGLVGYNAGSITNSDAGAAVVEASANTSGTVDYIGGIVGYNAASGVISGVTTAPIAGYTPSYNNGLTNTVAGSVSDIGGLAGYNTGSIAASTATGTVTSTTGAAAGGLVGYNDTGAMISGSSASGAVTIAAATGEVGGFAGGLAGYNDGTISGSSASGSVSESGTTDNSAINSVGGLVGVNAVNATITGSSATGAVAAQGKDYVGGLVGSNGGTISSSSATGDVSVTVASQAYAGGLVGFNVGGTIGGSFASFATGSVTIDGGGSSAGGLVGLNEGTITQAFATGAVADTYSGGSSDGSKLGGLVGSNFGAVSYAYAIGPVTAANATDDFVGGLVGFNDATVSQAYASGAVTAGSGSTLGGIAGLNNGTIDSTVFFDQTTTGQTAADGGTQQETDADAAVAINPGDGTLSPYAQTTYTNLDFGQGGFVIFEGSTRPFLQSEAVANNGVITNLHQLQLAALNPGFSYTLGAEIDATPTNGANPSDMWSTAGFSPIGTDATPYTGTFNGADAVSGADHTISNLTINTPMATSIGLFGNVGAAGTVENVILPGADITGFNAVGAVAGKNAGLVTDVILSADTVTGAAAVGGVVGKNFGTVAFASVASTSVTGDSYVGGLVGYNTVPNGSTAPSSAVVRDSTVSGSEVGDNASGSGDFIGGAVGYNDVGSVISNVSVANADVLSGITGAVDIGGLVGFNAGAIAGSPGIDTVSGVSVQGGFASNVGGVAGYNSGSISDVQVQSQGIGVSDFQESVTSGSLTNYGGVVGLNAAGGSITGAVAAIEVITNANAVGGIVGKNYGTVTGAQYGSLGAPAGGSIPDSVQPAVITLSGATSVSGQDAVGGIVGKNFGAVSNAIAYSGEIAGRSHIGGVVGWNTTPIGSTGGTPTVSASSAYEQVLGQADVGGLVGRNDAGGTISGSWADGTVGLQNYDATDVVGPIGGLVGYNAGAITTSYSGASVSDNDASNSGSNGRPIVIGGLIGENAGAVSDVYSIAQVNTVTNNGNGQTDTLGGLVGVNDAKGSITRGYVSGALTNTSNFEGKSTVGGPQNIMGTVGAVAGSNAGTLSNLYFDQSSTGEGTAVGANTGTSSVTRVGGSSNDPYAEATYSALDFGSTWTIIDGLTRPLLRAEYSTTLSNAHQLQLMELAPAAAYTLAGPIDASGTFTQSDVWRVSTTADATGNYGFVPVGTDAAPFTGSLSGSVGMGGNNYINDLIISRPASTSVGLIGALGAAGTVLNVSLSHASVTGLNAVGALVGKNSGAVIEAEVDNSTVNGAGGVGGVIGKNFGEAFDPIAYETNVTGSGTYVGGVVGYNGAPQGGTSTATATVYGAEFLSGTVTGTAANAENDVGGVVGYNAATGVVSSSASAADGVPATVTGAGYAVGGVVGKNFGGVQFSYADQVTVTGAAAVGGVVGKNFGSVSFDSTLDSVVLGAEYVGGLVGYNGVPQGSGSTTPAIVTGSYGLPGAFGQYTVYDTEVAGTAMTNAEADVGGVVGYNDAVGQITRVSTVGNLVFGAAVPGAGSTATGNTTPGGFAVGGVVGKNFGRVDITTSTEDDVYGSAAVGGVVGKNFGTVNAPTVNGSEIVGDIYVGGIVGYNGVPQGSGSTIPAVVSNAILEDAYILANGVSGTGTEADVGGIVGFNDAHGQVRLAASSGAQMESLGNAAGGIVGKNYGSVSFVYANDGVVFGVASVGGIVGRNFGSVMGAEADTGLGVSGVNYVGGAIGYSGPPLSGPAPQASVDQVVSRADVGFATFDGGATSGMDFGGLIGLNAGAVTNSYSTGSVTSTSATNVGGFVGYNTGTIATSYTISPVVMSDGTGGTNVGAFAGTNTGTLASSTYYDTSINATNGPADSSGSATPLPAIGAGTTTGGPTALTDAQAKMQSSYAGFDFTKIWTIDPAGVVNGGYPYLQLEAELAALTPSLPTPPPE